MIRWKLSARFLIALMMVAIGSSTLTAGVFEVLKSGAKKLGKNVVFRAQEPNPAPPAPLEVGADPAYEPLAPEIPAPGPANPTMDYAPQYAGFSDGSVSCHACPACREPASCCYCDRYSYRMGRTTRRLTGQSYYCDCYPLFGPRYGHYTTCWRRLPEDCRCPIFIPAKKTNEIKEPIPIEESEPKSEPQVPPPPPANAPQALIIR